MHAGVTCRHHGSQQLGRSHRLSYMSVEAGRQHLLAIGGRRVGREGDRGHAVQTVTARAHVREQRIAVLVGHREVAHDDIG